MNRSAGLIVKVSICFLMIPLVLSCASKVVEKEEYAGFLSDYSNLGQITTTDGAAAMGWTNTALKGRTYHSVMIDPVIVYPALKSTDRIDEATLKSMLRHFDAEIRRQVELVMPMVGQPGEGVARVRYAITRVDAGFRDLRWYEYMPVTLAVSSAGAAAGARDEAVEIFVEGEMIDSMTSEILAKVVRRGLGKDVGGSDEPIELENLTGVLDAWAKSTALYLEKTLLKE